MSRALKLVFIGLILFLISFILAKIAYQPLDDWTLIDVVYMVVITVFGVGYSEVHPIDTPELKAWTIAIIFCGCGSLILMTGGFIQLILEQQFNRFLTQKKMKDVINKLTGHIIVVGHGRVGSLLVDDLKAEHKKIVIIDLDSGVLTIREKEAIPVVVGDASDEEVLLEAGIQRASAIAVVLPNDALNVFITLSARGLSDKIEIVARGERRNTSNKLMQAGANHVVLPARSGAESIASVLLHSNQNVSNSRLSDVGLMSKDIHIETGSRFIGVPIEVFERQQPILVTAIHRGNIRLPEKYDVILESGDRLTVVVHD